VSVRSWLAERSNGERSSQVTGRFVFALQPLLDERRRVEDERRASFARARRARDESTGELDRLVDVSRSGAAALFSEAMAGTTARLRIYDAHLRHLAVAIESQRRRSGDCAAELERAATDLLHASRERRVIERLEERRRSEFEREEARRDELELDEANARAHERLQR
jgi:flagellar protein FliJ